MPAPDANKYAPGIPRSQYGFVGNADVYGVGIRAGYYTQAFAVWGANFFVPHEAPFLHSVNILFMIAMLVGLIFLVGDPENTWAVEPFMLLNITYSIAWIGTSFPGWLKENLPWEGTLKEDWVRNLSFMGLDGFAVWYWFVGLPKMKPTIGDLGTMVYWWNQGPLFGWVRTANQVVTCLDLVLRVLLMGFRTYIACLHRSLERCLTPESLKEQSLLWMPSYRSESITTISTGSRKAIVVKEQECKETSHDTRNSDIVHAQRPEALSSNDLDAKEMSSETAVSSRNLGSDNVDLDTKGHEEFAISPATPTRSTTATLPTYSQSYLRRQNNRIVITSHFPKHPSHPSVSDLSRAEDFFDSIISQIKFWPWYCHFPLWLYYWAAAAVLLARSSFAARPRTSLFVPILQYVKAQPCLEWHHIPCAICAILRHPLYSSRSEKVDWRALILIVRFRLALHPPGLPGKGRRLGEMWHFLSIGVMLAIGTELTIQWNYIKGIQTLKSVGQLIPMARGVGGFAKVIWGAFVGDEEWCGKRCKMEMKLRKWREIAEIWVEAKKAWAKERDKKSEDRKGEIDVKKETV